MAADGTVLIKATLDTVDVGKGVKRINEELQGITWKDLTEGSDRAKKLSGSLKNVGTVATASLTVPIVAAGAAVLDTAGQWDAADAVWIRDRVTLADNRLDQSRWMVREAVYELLHGNREKAYDLLAENERGPLTPGTRMWIERIKSQ